MPTSKNKLNLQRLLDLTDPVEWLRTKTGFKPFPYQIQILQDAHLKRRVIRKARQIGITTTIAHEVVWKALTKPNGLILIVSPSQSQSNVVMNKIQAILATNRELSKEIRRKRINEVKFRNGSTILSLPNNPDRLRGFSATDIYLDEAAHFLNDEPVMRALQPMLIATKGTFTIISTPFGKRGLFWNQYNNTKTLQNTRSDCKSYDLHPSTICPLITLKEMERDRLSLTDLEYKQEYLGEFIEEADVYFPIDLIIPCVDQKLELLQAGEPNQKYYGGVDFAKQQDETVVTLLDRGNDGTLRIRHISAWAHMDYAEQIIRIGELAKKFNIVSLTADETGVGAPIIDNLRHLIPTARGLTFTVNTKFNLASTLRTLLENKELKLPNNQKLIHQLNNIEYSVSNVGHLLFQSSDKQHTHDDYAWSLALACLASYRNPDGLYTLAGAKRQDGFTGRPSLSRY